MLHVHTSQLLLRTCSAPSPAPLPARDSSLKQLLRPRVLTKRSRQLLGSFAPRCRASREPPGPRSFSRASASWPLSFLDDRAAVISVERAAAFGWGGWEPQVAPGAALEAAAPVEAARRHCW